MSKPSDELIWINADGSARELTDSDKSYVDREFAPTDGARPYIKSHYEQRNGWGELNGYLERRKLPAHVSIRAAVAADRKDHRKKLEPGKLRFELHRPTWRIKLRRTMHRFVRWRARATLRLAIALGYRGASGVRLAKTKRTAVLEAVAFWMVLAAVWAAFHFAKRTN